MIGTRAAVPRVAVVLMVAAAAGLAPLGAQDAPLPASPSDRIERWHSWVESWLTRTGVRIDSFFEAHTPDGMALPTEESYGRIRLAPRYDDRSFRLGSQASVTLGMPNMERWLKLRFTTTPPEVLPGSDPVIVKAEPAIGTDVALVRRTRFSINGDFRLGWSGGADPYAGVRETIDVPWRRWRTRLVARHYWRESDGFGHFGELFFDRPLGQTLLLRFVSAFKWTQVGDEIESSQTARLGWIVEPNQRYVLFAATVFARDRLADNYRVELTTRFRTRWPWCYVELTPGADFPRERGFASQLRARVVLDVFFGGTPAL